jgi:hypothetical protein
MVIPKILTRLGLMISYAFYKGTLIAKWMFPVGRLEIMEEEQFSGMATRRG